MNTRDAAYLTGHHYPRGVSALALCMSMEANELSRKPNLNTGSLGLDFPREFDKDSTTLSGRRDEGADVSTNEKELLGKVWKP